jgi:hypothetical protein
MPFDTARISRAKASNTRLAKDAVLRFGLGRSFQCRYHRAVESRGGRDGAVYRKGARATRGLTVLVTDETGKPLEHAAVSFRLPEEGPVAFSVLGYELRSLLLLPMGAQPRGECSGTKHCPLEIRITAF